MLVRIVRQPRGVMEGVTLDHYHVGRAYDVDPSLANYLMVNEFAKLEMRRRQRSARVRTNDRRKSPTI
jgi:hypothetical protein